jgi:hypothetical protein
MGMNVRRIGTTLIGLAVVGVVVSGIKFAGKYRLSPEMVVAIEEVRTADYPEDPSHRSIFYDRYTDRRLRLVQKDDTHFDFIFESDDPKVASISLLDIDLTLFVPCLPDSVRGDKNLEIIALVDREWNRQQVRFGGGHPQLRIEGGDGFEKKEIHTVELARNCLNAGLWEILITKMEDGKKSLYYQGWFTFPLGHYKNIFEQLNGISYWKHWFRLEHWLDPEGLTMDLTKLRTVVSEQIVKGSCDCNETVVLDGEQVRKARTTNAAGVRCWDDFCRRRDMIQFASFIPPGRYSVRHPWGNQYERIESFENSVVRWVKPTGSEESLLEIELVFRDGRNGEKNRFLVSGIEWEKLPVLDQTQYSKGFYMPMGVGVPPFYQNYDKLKGHVPYEQPYFSFLLDADNRWINHHEVAIDGPVIHRDPKDPNKLHVYLLSYERHSIVGHYMVEVEGV